MIRARKPRKPAPQPRPVDTMNRADRFALAMALAMVAKHDPDALR
jgi:hypothetical protein